MQIEQPRRQKARANMPCGHVLLPYLVLSMQLEVYDHSDGQGGEPARVVVLVLVCWGLVEDAHAFEGVVVAVDVDVDLIAN